MSEKWPWNVWGLLASIETPILSAALFGWWIQHGPVWFGSAVLCVILLLWALCGWVEAGLTEQFFGPRTTERDGST